MIHRLNLLSAALFSAAVFFSGTAFAADAGMPAFPAPTNDIDTRLRAVEAIMGRQINGGPAIMINSAGCPWLVRALSGGYRFKKHKDGGLRTVPEKMDK
ncbi:MAG: hypothetical protein ACHQAZ_10305, partial [Gammaproteobacteria bacterium]